MPGGDIVSTRNLTEGTLPEALQKPLDTTDRPLYTDRTEGRFMALCEGYLDPAVYGQGRQVTLAGRVLGRRTDTLGEITYIYPPLPAWKVTSGHPCSILGRCISMATGSPGTVHVGGAPIPCVASDRLCGSPSALKEELCSGTG